MSSLHLQTYWFKPFVEPKLLTGADPNDRPTSTSSPRSDLHRRVGSAHGHGDLTIEGSKGSVDPGGFRVICSNAPLDLQKSGQNGLHKGTFQKPQLQLTDLSFARK